jgi:hypothetical protein
MDSPRDDLPPKDDAINGLDFRMIKMKLMDTVEGEGWSSEMAENAIEEYRKFLLMTKTLNSTEVVPSLYVDKVWHYHILDTHAYAEDCISVFGKFLHHFPYWGMRGEEDARSLMDAWQSTLATYETVFGAKPSADMWTAPGRCPNCGSGSCFVADTPIHCANGIFKKISELHIGDELSGGAIVTAVMKFEFSATDKLYDYNGVFVTGAHAVFENDIWTRVSESAYAKLAAGKPDVVYCINTSNHTLVAGEQMITFADWIETTGNAFAAVCKLNLMELNMKASNRAVSAC